MPTLRDQLARCLTGQIALVALGNRTRRDDGLAFHLLDRLTLLPTSGEVTHSTITCLRVGTELEQHLHHLTDRPFDHIIFIDAVDLQSPPGSAVLLDRADLRSRYPQTSTHRLSLSLVAQLIEHETSSRTWLLGIQPDSLRSGHTLTSPVERTIQILAEWLNDLLQLPDSPPSAAPLQASNGSAAEATALNCP